MALDRFIVFHHNDGPNKETTRKLLVAFLGGFADGEPEWGGGRWTIKLQGETTFPQGIALDVPHPPTGERWMEVYVGKHGNYSVITRSSDEATNCLATGFARMVARLYEGASWCILPHGR